MEKGENVFDSFIQKHKIPLLISLVGGVLLIGGLFSSGVIQKTLFKSTTRPPITQPVVKSEIKVDVSGAVKQPGVYSLKLESRIEDAIKVAGGVTTDVNPDYLSKSINLAQKVSDGMKIYIPKTGESYTSATGGSGVATVQSDIISLNAATATQLESLPGVGAVTAQKIIDNRPYTFLEELLNKKIVSKATYQKIKDQISI